MEHLRCIQQVIISPEITLFITKIDLDKKILSYRLSQHPKILNEEQFQIEGEKVKLPLYYFSIAYIQNFLKINS